MPLCGLLVLALVGCGGDDKPETVSLTTEAGVSPTVMDAGTVGLDASMHGSGDAAEAGGDANTLTAAECAGDVQALHAARTSGRPFSTALSGNRVYVAYPIPTCGGSVGNNHAQGIALVDMATSGTVDAPIPLVNAGSADCDLTESPVLAGVKGGKVVLFYGSNRSSSGGLQVFAKNALDDSAGVSLTSDVSTLQDLSARVDNSQVVQLAEARGGVISTVRLGQAARALTAAGAGYQIAQLALTSIGTGITDTTAAVAWISTAEQTLGIYLSFFDEQSGLVDPIVLTTQAGTGSSVALATQDSSAAVVYSDASGAVFMHILGRDKTVGSPIRLTSGNQQIGDVSLSRYGVGYAVAYRSIALAGDQSVVRLLAIDELGNQAGTRFIADARRDGRGIDVRVANDGRLILTWADPTSVINPDTQLAELETTVKVARLTCL